MASDLPPLSAPPAPISPRFTLELEFVLCLANPFYLQHLAVSFPHLLSEASTTTTTTNPDSDAAKFARYLAYLYRYWRTPQYSQYLTHPGAALRNLELLQDERFRREIIRPDVIGRLFEVAPKRDAAPAEGADDSGPEADKMDTRAG